MTEMLGNVSFKETEYLKEYSEAYSKKIDEEVRKLVDNAQTRSR
jgi:ATP-dependent Zn protease